MYGGRGTRGTLKDFWRYDIGKTEPFGDAVQTRCLDYPPYSCVFYRRKSAAPCKVTRKLITRSHGVSSPYHSHSLTS